MSASAKTKERIPNKTGWALDDIKIQCALARTEWKKCVQIARHNVDPVLAIHLAEMRDRLAEIERLAINAANGEYTTHEDHPV